MNILKEIPLSECTLHHKFDLGEFELLDVDHIKGLIKVREKEIFAPHKNMSYVIDNGHWERPGGFYWKHNK
jgi:hypothetical protein